MSWFDMLFVHILNVCRTAVLNVKSSVFRLVFGTLYPAYSSYKAVKSKDVKEYVSISFVFLAMKWYQAHILMDMILQGVHAALTLTFTF